MSDKISILVPTWNRSKFLPLLLHNIKSQDYPHELLTVVIDDDGDTPFIDDDSIVAVRNYLYPINLLYIKNKIRRTIGKKRNDLIKSCPTKIFAFMDDDDVYMNTYISYSYSVLKDNNLGCVGSDKMLFTMSDIDFDIHMIDCGNTKQLIHEATLMMTRKWYNASCKFGNNSKGEGSNLFYGHERTVGITDISKVMICLQHSGNTVDKLQFAKPDNKLDIQLSPELIEKLKSII
tara:strand:+ start:748 stop:1449 length:702 start_codon:yes stop_codon:yes gene_type:complete